jgi:predicted RNA-binding protein YlxR (DUF448 family)
VPAPIRTCVVCRRAGPAPALRLIVLGNVGGRPSAVLYRRGPRRGRGAWVCREGPCLERLRSRPERLRRALRRDDLYFGPGWAGLD